MTAADKPRRELGADCSCATFGGYDSLCVIHGHAAQTRKMRESEPADKPRPDLVALFDAFAALPAGHASLSLFGSEHESAFRAWSAQHGHRIEETPLYNPREGRWTSLAVTLAGGWITVHLDSIEGSKEQPEAAEGSV